MFKIIGVIKLYPGPCTQIVHADIDFVIIVYIYGSKQTIHYLIWYNYKVAVRLLAMIPRRGVVNN